MKDKVEPIRLSEFSSAVDRTWHLESKLNELITAYNTLHSDHDDLRTEYEQLRERVDRLEDKLSPSM